MFILGFSEGARRFSYEADSLEMRVRLLRAEVSSISLKRRLLYHVTGLSLTRSPPPLPAASFLHLNHHLKSDFISSVLPGSVHT